jgi:hemoglobin-like flavoprotein
MNITHPVPSAQADLTVVLALARLLDRIEQQPRAVTAEQYKLVAERLSNAMANVPSSDSLQAVLGAHPAAAELYENLNYELAGLCRSPLDQASQAELQARDLISRIRRPA